MQRLSPSGLLRFIIYCPPLQVLENPSTAKESTDLDLLKNRYLVRSMVLQCIYAVMDKNDGPFYSDSLENFLNNPAIILVYQHRLGSLGRQLFPNTKSKATPRKTFKQLLEKCLESAPGYKTVAAELGERVVKVLREIAGENHLPEGEADLPVANPQTVRHIGI